jgi:hypothetical protein
MWRQDAVPLAESPYLLHPIETGTAGLYKSPVAILVCAAGPIVLAKALTNSQVLQLWHMPVYQLICHRAA